MAQTYDHVRQPMRLLEAEAWVIAKLGATRRAAHSRFVGHLMAELARRLAADEAELWELTGLVHDLDFFVVDGDWHMHGRITAAWLEGRLPIPALAAIAAHDHRSGIIAEGALPDALKLCDALAVLDESAGRAAVLQALAEGEPALRALGGERVHLPEMIVGFSGRLSIELDEIGRILAGLPGQ